MFRKASSSQSCIESLEQRQLLSANLINGVLTVDGTPYADTISVFPNGTNLLVAENALPVRAFPAALVNSILVRAHAGNDRVVINSLITKPCQLLGDEGFDSLSGGSGSDYIDGSYNDDQLFGGAGNDNIVGGYGRDHLDGWTGDDMLRGDADNDVLLGWFGRDVLLGGAGNDVMRGEADDDRLYGEAGDDQMFGDTGNDQLTGGAGCDNMFGGDQNDYFFAYDGEEDNIDGGLGYDIAQVDDPFWPWMTHDNVLNCEVVFQP